MATARDICNAAGREIGVFAAGEAMPADDATDAMATLNRWIDSNAAERLQIYTITRNVGDIQANVSEYELGTVADYETSISDGFDTTWVDEEGPPGWTTDIGSGTIVNDTTDFQAGGHSVLFASGLSAQPSIQRDLVFRSGSEAVLTVWTLADDATVGHMQVVCIETGHYLQPDGTWSNTLDDVFDAPLGVVFVANTLTFDLEDESVVGAPTCTLRVKIYHTSAISVSRWDTFSIVTDAAGLSMPRPVALFPGNVRLIRADLDPELEIDLTMLTEEQWQGLTAKDLESTQPTHWYYNPTFPFGTLTFWPVPTGSDLSFAVYAPTQVPQFATLDDVVSLPPGYERMLVKNLALELAPSYKVQPSGLLVKQAAESLATVKRANIREVDMKFPAASLIGNSGRIYNIRTG